MKQRYGIEGSNVPIWSRDFNECGAGLPGILLANVWRSEMTLEEWQTVKEGSVLIHFWTGDEYIVLQPIVGDERMGVQRHRLKHTRSGRKLPPTSDYSLWEMKR